MFLFGDYHTHTPYSHGKNTVSENVQVAKEKQLKQIAITDHGFGHSLFAVKRNKFNNLIAECKEAAKEHNIEVLVGVEANLISNYGDIDVTKEDYEKLDILLMGWHNFVKTTFKQKLSLFCLNYFFNVFGTPKWKKKKNTQAYINAIKKHPIDVITHLNYGMKVNTLEVAKFARDNNVLIELNGKRIKFTDEEMLEMAKENVKFIINSDAHSKNSVAETNKAINLITRLNIPEELIVNLNKKPVFKKINKN